MNSEEITDRLNTVLREHPELSEKLPSILDRLDSINKRYIKNPHDHELEKESESLVAEIKEVGLMEVIELLEQASALIV